MIKDFVEIFKFEYFSIHFLYLREMISILMPARNAGKYIAETLDSVIEQSMSDWELIVVNDHSEDDTEEILNRYKDTEDRITVLENIGKGIIDALNMAFENCSGEFVTRMDADDIMTMTKLERLQMQLVKFGHGFVATGIVEYFSDEILGYGYLKYAAWLNELTLHEQNFDDIYRECVIPSPAWMMYKSDLVKIGGITNNRYPEDYDLCFRMKQHDLRVTTIKEVIHMWRDYPERTSRNDPNYADNRFFDIKLDYFFAIDYLRNRDLCLLGAGKKAKYIAKELVGRQVEFEWFTNNMRKVGKEIYGQNLRFEKDINPIDTKQFIIAISNSVEQLEIRENLESSGLCLGQDFFFFC